MRIALAQTRIIFEDKEANFAKAERFMKTAADKGAQLIVFPEMSLTGFSMNSEKIKEKDKTKRLFAEAAKNCGIAVGFGYVGDFAEGAKNMFAVIDANGSILMDQAKIHPFSYAGEDKHYTGGNRLESFVKDGVKTMAVICYDLRFCRLFGGDSELVLVPANWPHRRAEHWQTLLKARAVEMQAYVAGINCVGDMDGEYYSGGSAVFDPEGREICSLYDEEGIIYADVEAEKARQIRADFPVRADRRPDSFYSALYRADLIQ